MQSRKTAPQSKQSFVFSKNEFDRFVSQYGKYNLSYRIENVIVKHAKKCGEKFTFYLHWPDSLKKSHELKVTFSRADHFGKDYSWVADEKTLLKQVPFYVKNKIKPGQCYYSLSVKESDIEILSVWLAMDGLIGELHDLQKGESLSGNDLLGIYAYFDQFFKIKNTLICDESRLADEKDDVRIPLRLISSLCTEKTWYQAKLPGVKLFECDKFKSAHNGLVTQHFAQREKALNQLQKLKLSEWYEMLDENEQLILIKLFHLQPTSSHTRQSLRLFTNKQVKIGQHSFGESTLQDLATLLFNDSKLKRRITPGLEQFTDLLCGRLHWEYETEINKTQSDYWVKSRVKEILWGGYFWIKEADSEEQSIRTTSKCMS